MTSSLGRKLEHYIRLSDDDRRVLVSLGERAKRVGARDDIIREGDRPRDAHLIISGWACRYKALEDGRRQIVDFLVPGDLYDLDIFMLRAMDHSVGAITAVTYAEIGRDAFEIIETAHPQIVKALRQGALVAAATQREWTLNVGQRTAIERLGHLLCEMFVRLRTVGLTRGDSCDFPLTQIDLADATGLTAVHVNRTLQEMRGRGLIRLKGRELSIPDLQALKDMSLFNDNYLHLEPETGAARG